MTEMTKASFDCETDRLERVREVLNINRNENNSEILEIAERVREQAAGFILVKQSLIAEALLSKYKMLKCECPDFALEVSLDRFVPVELDRALIAFINSIVDPGTTTAESFGIINKKEN